MSKIKFWIENKKYEVPEALEKEFVTLNTDRSKNVKDLQEFIKKHKMPVIWESDPNAQANAQKGVHTIDAQRLIKFEELVEQQSAIIQDLMANKDSKAPEVSAMEERMSELEKVIGKMAAKLKV